MLPDTSASRITQSSVTIRTNISFHRDHYCNKLLIVASEFGSGAPDKTFYLFDMENKCSKKLPDHPNAVYGHAVGAFKGQVLACSGRVGGYGSTLIDTCHLLTSQGWSQVSSTLVRGRCVHISSTVCLERRNQFGL